jgi:ABC-2 type transport system ATP-binding protein
VIAVDGLTKRFGRSTVVDDLTFEARAGRVTGFLGPNGSGKTTTLRMILGLVHADAGAARFDGRRYAELVRPTAHVGAVLEDASFHPGRSARDHLRVLAAAGCHAPRRVDEVLREVRLEAAADRRVKGFSTGMRQRLAIAAALLGDPAVLILDEPTNGLDPPGIRWIRDLLRAHAARGRTVLVSSHLLSEAALSVDDLVVIAGGRLRASGPLERVLGEAGRGDGNGAGGAATVVRAQEGGRLADALRGAGHGVEPAPDGALLVRGAAPEDVGLIAAEHGIALAELRAVAPTLEDAFLALTEAVAT